MSDNNSEVHHQHNHYLTQAPGNSLDLGRIVQVRDDGQHRQLELVGDNRVKPDTRIDPVDEKQEAQRTEDTEDQPAEGKVHEAQPAGLVWR